MITGEIKSKVDRIWDTMWSGGISNPLSVIEQLTYLLFIKRLDELHTLEENKAARTGKPIREPIFARIRTICAGFGSRTPRRRRCSNQGGCVAPTGDAGSMLMFSSLLVHAGPANISPMDRTIVYLSLCHVDNHIRQFKRPEWVAHRDFKPIEPLADDTLRELIA